MTDASKLLGATQAYNATQQRGTVPAAQTATNTGDFTHLVTNALDSTVTKVVSAEAAGSQAMLGKVGIDDLALAVNNAELSLRSVVAVRDRVITAYQEIIKMPI